MAEVRWTRDTTASSPFTHLAKSQIRAWLMKIENITLEKEDLFKVLDAAAKRMSLASHYYEKLFLCSNFNAIKQKQAVIL